MKQKNNMSAVQQKQNIPSGWQSTFIDDICHIMKGQGLSKKDIDSSGKNKCVLYGVSDILFRNKERTS